MHPSFDSVCSGFEAAPIGHNSAAFDEVLG